MQIVSIISVQVPSDLERFNDVYIVFEHMDTDLVRSTTAVMPSERHNTNVLIQ